MQTPLYIRQYERIPNLNMYNPIKLCLSLIVLPVSHYLFLYITSIIISDSDKGVLYTN